MKKPTPPASSSLPPFERVAFTHNAGLLGARWLHQGMTSTRENSLLRRDVLKNVLKVSAALTIVAVALLLGGTHGIRAARRALRATHSLELQQEQGWAIWSDGYIEIPDTVSVDSAQSADWALHVASLAEDLTPDDVRLLPLHVPTLFDVLHDERNAKLVRQLRPMNTWDMRQTSDKASGLADLFEDSEEHRATALVLDLPGSSSVAAAASLAPLFTPVFLFDNWPHPLGVVPSHLTLAAAIYCRPDFVAAAEARSSEAPPVFVLDSNRLLPYSHQGDRFDNRYFARMPSASALQRLGVQRLLYVTAMRQEHEQDDLNDDFLTYVEAKIDVKLVALDEFEQAPEQDATRRSLSTYHGHDRERARSAFHSSYYRDKAKTDGRWDWSEPPEKWPPGAGYVPHQRQTGFKLDTKNGSALHFDKSTPNYFGRVSPYSRLGGSSGPVASPSNR